MSALAVDAITVEVINQGLAGIVQEMQKALFCYVPCLALPGPAWRIQTGG